MVQKIKKYLETHQKEYELIRYVIAGGLTTLLSYLIKWLYCVAVAPDHTFNGALPEQVQAGSAISWVICVVFAFWINRQMVFCSQKGTALSLAKELGQFALSRLASGLLFEQGLLWVLINVVKTSNVISTLIVQVLVVVFNYVVSKFWIFAKKQPAAQESTTKEARESDPPPPKAAQDP